VFYNLKIIYLKDEVITNPTKTIPQTFNEIRRSIMASGIQGSTEAEVKDALPIYTSVKSSAYRKRMKLMPTLPKKLSELDIEGDWRSTNDGKDFLLGIYTKLFKRFNYIYYY
jgi:hypothetical protein